MVETALRGVVVKLGTHRRERLQGAHHFYITSRRAFRRRSSRRAHDAVPEEMTVVSSINSGSRGRGRALCVTLSFHGRPERVSIPFEAITSFTDPSVKFGLQFQPGDNHAARPRPPSPGDAKKKADNKGAKSGEVVTLDHSGKNDDSDFQDIFRLGEDAAPIAC